MELIKWNAARQAIIEAKTVDEVKSIKDKAEAMRAYAKQVGESLTVQNDICEIKLRAERKMGEMLKEMPKNQGAKGKGINQYSNNEVQLHDVTTPTLKDMGIEKHESSRYQKIAELPEEKFEEIIQETKVEEKELTEALMLSTAKKIDREIKIQKQKDEIEKGINNPIGKYDIIVIDPPWNYGGKYDPNNRRATSPYPEMTQEELIDIDIPSNENSILFLWTTHKFIWDAKKLMELWGFEYKNILVWDKVKMGLGEWLRKQCEFCLIGVRGKPVWDVKDMRDIITEARTNHSKKPSIFYELINKNFVGRKLDYFARKKREGWDVYGDEV
jgi:N6-adenosine-specific RNA methylase IME4